MDLVVSFLLDDPDAIPPSVVYCPYWRGAPWFARLLSHARWALLIPAPRAVEGTVPFAYTALGFNVQIRHIPIPWATRFI